MKTSELTGPALDWAVAKCEGWEYDDIRNAAMPDRRKKYSTNWSQGGPIIERENIAILPPIVRRITKERHAFPVDYWRALIQTDENELATHGKGPTPLIAAMRCYVASKLGEEVEVPDGLV